MKQGDSIAKLAEAHGLFPGTIWDHPENDALKRARRHMNVLAPGDVVFIPDKRMAQVPCETGKRHVFRRHGVPMMFKLELLDGSRPRAHVPYTLEVDGVPFEGTTDGQGRIARYVPNRAVRARLVADGGAVDQRLDFGHMDPIETVGGVQKRLINLGYALADPEGTLGDTTRAALRRFQFDVGLPPSGAVDDETCAELARCHDDPGAYSETLQRAAELAGVE